ncbi:tetratricopeptide repeat protein [Akkermansiaceae bacterium]|nr:tetratricopeptide repeat protein [Akkermansiaceae bacterium]
MSLRQLPLLLIAVGFLTSCTKNIDNAQLASTVKAGQGPAKALYDKGRAAEAAGKSSKAIKIYRNLARNYPLSSSAPEAKFRQASLLDRSGKLLEAFDEYNDLLAKYPASSEKVDIVETDRQKLEFSYAEPGMVHFMDMQTYETIGFSDEFVGDAKNFIKEGQSIEVLFVEGNAVSLDLPSSVELEVTDSSEGIKGDTANNPTKPATLETGLTIQVPLFVKPGDILKVSTEDSSYLGRA